MQISNAPELHHEVRGTGTPVLLIPGVPGDGGQFNAVADALADCHKVITYDRRGYSRSPRPVGWNATTVAEQAADAAQLLERLADAPSVVYGTSNGALFAIELALTRPDLVAAVMLHEPPLLSVLADPQPATAAIGGILEPAFAAGGADAALTAFLRFAYGDATIDRLSDAERTRMLANGEVAMTIELPVTQPYRPQLSGGLAVPAAVVVGADQQVPFFHEAAEWLATELGTSVRSSPGAHGPQFDRPGELAEEIASFAAAVQPTSTT
jgi:pimeloyl-ACP methyl ester carboxylesterase